MYTKIKLSNNTEITYTQLIFRVDTKELEIHFPFSAQNKLIIVKLHRGEIVALQDIPVTFEWNGQSFRGVFYGDIRDETPSPANEYIVSIKLKNIIDQKALFDAQRVYFFIPQVELPRNDKNDFFYLNRQWRFKLAWKTDVDPLAYYPSEMLENQQNSQRMGIFLETDYNKGTDIEQLKEAATDIGYMLGFAHGIVYLWQSLWCCNGTSMKLLECSNYNMTTQEHSPVVFYKDILPNNDPIWVSSPMCFLETISSEYDNQRLWWRGTFQWIQNGYECDNLEVVIMIKHMLLDRVWAYISTIIKAAAFQRNKKIQLCNSKKEKENYFSTKLDDARKRAYENDNSFLDICSNIIGRKSYVQKVSSLLLYCGYTITKDDKKILNQRNSQMHEGNINIKDKKIIETENHLTKMCLLLILAMLGYDGYFNARTKHYKVSDLAPYWDRLKISNVQNISQRLFSFDTSAGA